MARMVFQDDLDVQITQLEGMERDAVKRIVMAGAAACAEAEKNAIDTYRHVGTGSMRESVRPGEYREDVGSGSVYVYPQDNDGRGVSNAKKAFVIDNGLGRKPMTARSRGKMANKTGDHFITRKTKKQAEEVTVRAMEAEYDRIVAENT